MGVFPSVIYSLSILLLGANAIQSKNLAGKCDEQGQRHPLKVQIKAEESGEICDGSILSLNHILTKASCVYNQSVDQIFMLDHPEVFAEQNEPNLSTFRKISIFPNFGAQNSSNNQEDFAILTLTKPLLEKPESQILSVMSWMKEVIAEELPESEDQSKESEDLAIMITGGDTETRWVTVELLRSDGSFWCSLPDLPGPRVYHTQNGLVTCGGRMSLSPGPSCVTFTSGEWFKSHSLIKDRTDHFSWISPQGILLMGEYEDDSTELLTPDGLSKLNFTMKLPNFDSCPIQLKDKVIVTGGGLYYTARKVIAYNLDGWLEDLPDLIDRRFGHGCGHFTNTDGLLVYLVTGGKFNDNLVSTEILVSGTTAWKKVGEIPLKTVHLRGVSIDNRIIMTGGSVDQYSMSGYTSDLILSFNTSSYTWETVGRLTKPRSGHAASVVHASDVIDYCK